jgi:hypothetical protein
MISRSDPRIEDLNETQVRWAKGDSMHRKAAILLDELVTTLLTRRLPKRQWWGLRIDHFASEDLTVMNGDRKQYVQEGDVIARGSAYASAHVGICEMIMLAAKGAGLRSALWRNEGLETRGRCVFVSLGG